MPRGRTAPYETVLRRAQTVSVVKPGVAAGQPRDFRRANSSTLTELTLTHSMLVYTNEASEGH